MAQQYFTIPATGVYGTYKFYENDQIPMELAVELGIEGAALTEGDYFSSEEQAAIIDTVSAGASLRILPAYDETMPPYLASAASNPGANTLVLMEAPLRSDDLTVGVVRVYVAVNAAADLKVGVYTFDGTTFTLLGSSAATAVGGSATVQAVSLSAPVTVPGGTRRYYGLVTDSATPTFGRMPGPPPVLVYLDPYVTIETSAFTLPATLALADTASTNLAFWLRGGAA